MKDVTIRQLEAYLLEHYKKSRTEEGLFIKLVEEVGEVAEVLNGRSGRKAGVQDSNIELAIELADIIHYTVAIAAINNIDLTKTIFEKDKKASIKYNHERNLEQYLDETNESSHH
ncbi:MazG nucleotide pyrophosphohydrolase domain-containing protein [Streptococcus timonensis]|uniref:MazG nucleotide pyrophosphohydrolase domain-containing protein n=1 Tax=Streptococcus timonensis TaxID=1852387 RepID=UPI0039C274A8